jgi:hypothetical protein
MISFGIKKFSVGNRFKNKRVKRFIFKIIKPTLEAGFAN